MVNTQFHKFYGRSFARVLYFILMKDGYRSVNPLHAFENSTGYEYVHHQEKHVPRTWGKYAKKKAPTGTTLVIGDNEARLQYLQ